MLRIRLLSLAFAACTTMLLSGCYCTGICLSWQHGGGCGGCGSGGCGSSCGGCGNFGGNSCCEPRTCCDIPVSRQGNCICVPHGGMGSVPVGDMFVNPGAGLQQGNPPRVVPVPQAQPVPYQP